ncbi:MAG: hypothetical protein WBP64_02450 [Nitrososphaeraceae archaeon]
MESPIMTDMDSPISNIIGILIENNAYEVFIKLASNSIASIKILGDDSYLIPRE